jgi:hypothetical protein
MKYSKELWYKKMKINGLLNIQNNCRATNFEFLSGRE